MKFSTPVLLVSLLSVGLVSASPAELLSEEQILGNFVDDIINKTISGLISSLNDPYTIEQEGHMNLTIPKLSTGDVYVSDLMITGLKKIVAEEINSDILNFQFNAKLKVPQLSVTSKYNADALFLKLVPLFGKGKFGLDVEGVELKLSATFNLSPFSISNVTLNFDIDKAVFELRGFLDNEALSELIEEVLNDNVVDFIKNHHELVDKGLSAAANLLLNNRNNTIAFPEPDEELATFQKEFESLKLE